jgi:hypothetical protein
MSSVTSHILNHTRTGGHLIGLGVTDAHFYPASAYVVPPSSGTGYLNAAGSCFNYATAANALTAAYAALPTAGEAALTSGLLFEDMGDRLLFSAQGQTILIFAKVRQLAPNGGAYEGNETSYYTCIWAGSPAVDGANNQAVVGVARL